MMFRDALAIVVLCSAVGCTSVFSVGGVAEMCIQRRNQGRAPGFDMDIRDERGGRGHVDDLYQRSAGDPCLLADPS